MNFSENEEIIKDRGGVVQAWKGVSLFIPSVSQREDQEKIEGEVLTEEVVKVEERDMTADIIETLVI